MGDLLTGVEVYVKVKDNKEKYIGTLNFDRPKEFNIGDTVEVITELEVEGMKDRIDGEGNIIFKDGFRFVTTGDNSMSSFYGKQVVIKDKFKAHDGTYRYKIEGCNWRFTDDILFSINDVSRLRKYKDSLIERLTYYSDKLELARQELNRINSLLGE